MAQYGLRPMTEQDLTLVWKWRNDNSVRSVSKSQAQIPWADHLKWFKTQPGERYIFMEDQRSIGVLLMSQSGYWSFYLDPDLPKGQGYGSIMLTLFMVSHKRRGQNLIRAQVMSSNTASLRLHYKLGFQKAHEKDGICELIYMGVH